MKISKIIFWTISIAYLAIISMSDSNLKYILKPSIILCLLVYYWFSAKGRPNKIMIIALIFSISGDFWLMFTGPNYFLLGLGSFLITHLCYILVFSKLGDKDAIKLTTFVPFGSVLIIMLSYLWPNLADFKIPVIVYASTIITMGFMAYSLRQNIPKSAWIYIFGGSLLFIVSDSLIALGKFKGDELSIPNIHFWIMVTYIVAQFLIVEGVLKVKETW